jgi:hypothetical protein
MHPRLRRALLKDASGRARQRVLKPSRPVFATHAVCDSTIWTDTTPPEDCVPANGP